MGRPHRHRLNPADVFGLRPLRETARQCRRALSGDGLAPAARWDLTSLRILMPRVALPLWLGRSRRDRRVIITQLPNRYPVAADDGYSVRCTVARDFRGRRMSYDSHIGPDFAVPPGTEVVAPAAGVVRLVEKRMERGGLKVCIDHGAGLVTTLGHLARALVAPGQRVARGEIIALSGMSSVDGILFFPWLAPHVHVNVVLGGRPVDPFAAPGEVAMWRTGNRPEPHRRGPSDGLDETDWDELAVRRTIAGCRSPTLSARLSSIGDMPQRAFETLIRVIFEPHLFSARPRLTARDHDRRPLLDLPFAARDYDGVVFADEL